MDSGALPSVKSGPPWVVVMMIVGPSLRLNADAPGDVFPFAIFGLDELAKFLGRVATRQHIALIERCAHHGSLERGRRSLLARVYVRSRRARRRQQAVPR